MTKKRKVTHFVGGSASEFLKQQLEHYNEVVFEFTNYTSAVITPKGKYVFHSSHKIKKPFAVFNQLKKQIKDSGMPLPVVDRSRINWYRFSHRKNFPESFKIVDLTSAYARVLYKSKVITLALYEKLTSKIDKEDRLAAVGFLGTKKSRVYYKEGEYIDTEVVKGELSDWFFYCCWVTGEVMEIARNMAGEDFMFYWVDGIAVKNDDKAIEILEYIRSLGYPAKIEEVTGCKVKKNTVIYHKDGKRKSLCIPRKRSVDNYEAVNFLSEHYERKRIKVHC